MTATSICANPLAPRPIVRHLNGMRRRDLLIRLGVLGGGLAGAWWVRDHLLWPAPEVRFSGAAWLPWAAPRIPLPIAEATVGGVRTRALIDSGAQYSVIDRGLYERMGRPPTVDLPTVAYGLSGRPQLGKGATVEVRLGDAHMPRVRTAILDLGPLADADGVGTPLILGQDVLGKAVLDLDLADRRLRLLPPGAARPDRVSPVTVRKAGRALGVEVT
ncbi:MAG: peptidase aspartic, partial [Brevundimonas sp.]